MVKWLAHLAPTLDYPGSDPHQDHDAHFLLSLLQQIYLTLHIHSFSGCRVQSSMELMFFPEAKTQNSTSFGVRCFVFIELVLVFPFESYKNGLFLAL